MSSWKQKRTVKRRYDATAKMYDARYTEEQEAKYQAALSNDAARGMVLDAGCGTGLFFKYVSPNADSVVGIDFSKNLLLQALKRSETMENVSLLQADADHLPFKNDTFDAVFSFTVLQNMPKPAETLTELRRVARYAAAVTVTGLKKTLSVDKLSELLFGAGLRVVSVKDDEKMACHVAISVK